MRFSVHVRFVAAISQGFPTCLKLDATLAQQKLHRVAATKIACVNGPLKTEAKGDLGDISTWNSEIDLQLMKADEEVGKLRKWLEDRRRRRFQTRRKRTFSLVTALY